MGYRVVYNKEDFIAHHGIKGMKWGLRRYQDYDGSLTTLGRKRYNSSGSSRQTSSSKSSGSKGSVGRSSGGLKKTVSDLINYAMKQAIRTYTNDIMRNYIGPALTAVGSIAVSAVKDLTGF